MRVGLDFDNTIVSYDRLFYGLALEQGLIPASLSASKSAVRNFLRANGREDAWIALQGLGYGHRMAEAEMFPGAARCIKSWLASGIDVCIVSHKTRQPYSGEGPDLQAAAHAWLESRGFYDAGSVGLGRSHVHFETTKLGKLRRIAELGCDWFVDDLPELLSEPAFPAATRAVLFDPAGTYSAVDAFLRAASWDELTQLIGAPVRIP